LVLNIYTIGFTKTSAESFFSRLQIAEVRTVVDVRLNNVSQLAGFAKRDDLRYFLRSMCGLDYSHRLDLAPTQEMLDGYRSKKTTWAEYETSFLELISGRRIEHTITRDALDGACLLCSEDKPHRCHRRLVAEYLSERWGGIEITHL